MIYEKISGIPKNTSICSWWCLDYLNEKQVELHYTRWQLSSSGKVQRRLEGWLVNDKKGLAFN